MELIYVGILSQTPMVLSVEDGNVICHQMKDDYAISISDIEDISLGSDSSSLKLRKESGYDMEPKYKGKYSIDDESGCISFLDLDTKVYIVIRADGKKYYINAPSDEETQKVYNEVVEQLDD